MCFCVVLIELVVDLGASVSVFLCSSKASVRVNFKKKKKKRC